MSRTAQDAEVVVTEATEEQWQEMLERLATERFGRSWESFIAGYRAGEFIDGPLAREAEELAFLSPSAG